MEVLIRVLGVRTSLWHSRKYRSVTEEKWGGVWRVTVQRDTVINTKYLAPTFENSGKDFTEA